MIESYLLADEVLYYGAVIHDTFEEYLHRKKLNGPNMILKNTRVPIKGGPVDHTYVDWQAHLKVAKEGTRSAEAVLRTFYRKVSGKARQYVDNSLAVYLGSNLSSERPTAK